MAGDRQAVKKLGTRKNKRHECGDLNCPDFLKQMVSDACTLIQGEAYSMIDSGMREKPVVFLEAGFEMLRVYSKSVEEQARERLAAH